MTASMSWAGATARRLREHALAGPPAPTPADVAVRLCGAHAQVMSAAEVSVAIRLDGATRSTVRAALSEDRSLVKTYGPRGTVHLLAADDLPMWTGALSAVPSRSPFPEGVRLTPAQATQVVEAIADSLADRDLTLDELNDEVVRRAGAWAGERVMPAFQELWPRWRQVITQAAHRGVLAFGPSAGRTVTYTNPRVKPWPATRALATLVRHYLAGYGPATPQQFAQWLGAPPAWAAELFASMAADLIPVDFEGGRAWVAEAAVAEEPPAGVRLLPYFDAYLIGSHPRAKLYPGPAATRALSPTGQAGNFPVVLVDGVVAGVWHQKRSGRTIAVAVELLGRSTVSLRRRVEAEAERVAHILEGAAKVTFGPVTVGGHA